jgi:hypothetical protein
MMFRRIIVGLLTVLAMAPAALLAQQERPKFPADLTFRDDGKTKHYDNVRFDSDSIGSFWLYTKAPRDTRDYDSREQIPPANIKSIEFDAVKKLSGTDAVLSAATVTLVNNDVLKGWVYASSRITMYQNSLPAPMNKELSKLTKIVFSK